LRLISRWREWSSDLQVTRKVKLPRDRGWTWFQKLRLV